MAEEAAVASVAVEAGLETGGVEDEEALEAGAGEVADRVEVLEKARRARRLPLINKFIGTNHLMYFFNLFSIVQLLINLC